MFQVSLDASEESSACKIKIVFTAGLPAEWMAGKGRFLEADLESSYRLKRFRFVIEDADHPLVRFIEVLNARVSSNEAVLSVVAWQSEQPEHPDQSPIRQRTYSLTETGPVHEVLQVNADAWIESTLARQLGNGA